MKRLSNQHIKDRVNRPIRVMQFGGGNFNRAFVDWMIDQLNEHSEFNGGVAIVKPTRTGDYADLRAQDGLFHVILKGIVDGQLVSEKRLVTCIQQIVHPYLNWSEYLKLAENNDIRFIVSNTTESGIQFEENDQWSDQPPVSFPAKLTKWLFQRYLFFKGDPARACIILPLELIPRNGAMLQGLIAKYARKWNLDSGFEAWLSKNIFCDTLVDRIVSGYPTKQSTQIENELGFEDKLLVAGEFYHSWVIQGPKEIENELPFAKVNLNVKIVDDLEKYRQIKVRILNGAHTALVPIGYLKGYRTVLEAMEDNEISNFIRQLLLEEIIPNIDHNEIELLKFAADVIDRFRNPTIQHMLLDISLNSTSKFVTRLLPSLLDYHEKEGECPPRIVQALAALIRFYKGELNGNDIPLKDDPEKIEIFKEAWAGQSNSMIDISNIVLSSKIIWGRNLTEIDGLAKDVTVALENMSSLVEH